MKSLQKQGIPGQFKEKQNNDKNTLHLPRQHLLFCEKPSVYAGLRA